MAGAKARAVSLSAPVTDLKGIGEKTAKLFDACGVRSVGELLQYWPRTYEHFEAPVRVRDFSEGALCAVSCTLLRQPALKHVQRYAILTGDASDGADTFHVTWYNQPYLKNTLYVGRRYVLRGTVRRKGRFWLMEQPGIWSQEDYDAAAGRMLPRYPLVKGLRNNTVIKAMREALSGAAEIVDAVPADCAAARGLMPLPDAVRALHFPPDEETRARARSRIAYDEFFRFLMGIRLLRAADDDDEGGIAMKRSPLADALAERLPYALTGAQKRVLAEIGEDMTSGRHMHRLIQGDVGSGKTILALLAMLCAVENGYQAALMAPTQVLAAQHYESFLEMTKRYQLPFRPVLLSGTLTAKQRRLAHEAIAAGEVNCVIGTNALMQEGVTYSRLGLVITDEQHRFGVRQREFFAKKGERPHVLVMSATPIPRTLAMILYGDLHVSLLDEMPAGRKRIKNAVVGPAYRPKAYRFIADEVAKGRQAYVICPMIEEGEIADAENVTDYEAKLRAALPASVRTEVLHGRMRPEEKDEKMERFVRHAVDVLISTTVIEVGVNVPNATVMMIENAERFGLAALHQLRGRVGRGEEQSYCIFVNTSSSEEAKERLEILKESVDGFEIADRDLKLRGPGDLFGVRQSGEMAFGVADIYADAQLLRDASADVDHLLTEDPKLDAPAHKTLRDVVFRQAALDFTTL